MFTPFITSQDTTLRDHPYFSKPLVTRNLKWRDFGQVIVNIETFRRFLEGELRCARKKISDLHCDR